MRKIGTFAPLYSDMIITRTPFRISFVGGGSDLPSYYHRKAGAVLSTSIDKYMYLSTHRFFEKNRLRVKYSRTETVQSPEELQHPILRVVLERFNIRGGIEISSIADVPSGTGMGSSSSFTVGLLQNIHEYVGLEYSAASLAEMACDIEIRELGEPIGKQDQYAAACGGLNIIRFMPDERVEIEPLILQDTCLHELQDNLMMFYTGVQRSASSILKEQNDNTIQKSDKFEILGQMVSLVDDLKSTLETGRLDDFGRILHENWILKQQMASSVSSNMIDKAYQTALENGALGGKLLGAGGGGFLLFYVKPGYKEKLRRALHTLEEFDMHFENEGTKVIYYGNE
jgi:D-glycero-alpha-D-manno-heptose-7-phosphate kinase